MKEFTLFIITVTLYVLPTVFGVKWVFDHTDSYALSFLSIIPLLWLSVVSGSVIMYPFIKPYLKTGDQDG